MLGATQDYSEATKAASTNIQYRQAFPKISKTLILIFHHVVAQNTFLLNTPPSIPVQLQTLYFPAVAKSIVIRLISNPRLASRVHK
jgi:hypothetical protein